MKIGYRTIKTAIGTPIAVSIAQLLSVSNVVSAGILTILCIQPSRKRSVVTAWKRFIACILAIIFSIGFFEILGYSAFVLGLLLAIFIPTTVFLKIDSGILTGTVITLNIFHFGMIKTTFIYEQLLLIIIGIGTGLLVNVYMPSLDKELVRLQKQLEDNIKTILHELASYIKEGKLAWDGKEINTVHQILKEAEQLVERDKENHLLRENHTFDQYFLMRKKQFTLLKQMLPLATRIPKRDDISNDIADFFTELAEAVHPGDTAIIYLQQLADLREQFKSEELPQSQEEFETRASLFQLLFLIEGYLNEKRNFQHQKLKRKKKKSSYFESSPLK